MATTAAVVGSVATVAGTAYGMSQSSKASKAASSAADSSSYYYNTLADIAANNQQRYNETFAPLENSLVREASLPANQTSGYLSQEGNINRQYANFDRNTAKTLGGRYQYGSGLEQSSQRSNELNRVRSLSDAESTANQNRLSNLMSLANLGRGLSTNATSALSSAAQGQSSLANMYAGAASNSGNSVGNTLGSLAQMYQLYNNSYTPSSGNYSWGTNGWRITS